MQSAGVMDSYSPKVIKIILVEIMDINRPDSFDLYLTFIE